MALRRLASSLLFRRPTLLAIGVVVSFVCSKPAHAQYIDLIQGCSIGDQWDVPHDATCVQAAADQAAVDWNCIPGQSGAACDVNYLTDFLNLECFCPPDHPHKHRNYCRECGDPVDVSTGIFLYEHTDLTVADVMPIELTRSYRQNYGSAAFGIGMSDNYDLAVYPVPRGGLPALAKKTAIRTGDQAAMSPFAATVNLVMPDGGVIPYTSTLSGGGLSATFVDNTLPTEFFGSTIVFNSAGYWLLTMKNGTTMQFGRGGLLTSITDRNGNTVQIQRDTHLSATKITSSNGRWIALYYDSNHRVYEAQDNSGRTTWYVYNPAGYLTKFYDANGGLTSYGYDSSNRMASYTTPNGNVHANNKFDGNNRVIQQTQPDGGQFIFNYTTDSNNDVIETDMTNPRGYVVDLTFDPNGYSSTETWAAGQPEQQVINYNRDPVTALLNSTTDQLGRTTAYTYDRKANVLSVTEMAGTLEAASTSYSYDPIFSQLTSITDPNNHTWTIAVDPSNGNTTSVTDPLSEVVISAQYNGDGTPKSVTNGVSMTTQFNYTSGLLTSITDPLLNPPTQISYDAVGHPLSVTDPLGNTTNYQWDLLDDVAQIVDANGVSTVLRYDGDQNVLSVTDGNGNVTSYHYDKMDRTDHRTDGLGHTDYYSYDGNSNLTRQTDRRGKISIFTYDGLDRPRFAGYGQSGSGYESTINYGWDGGDRETSVADSIAGSITRHYDDFDNLQWEISPQGTINYTYDPGNRRATMQVAGQPVVNYSFDDANRLIGITQGTQSVGMNYDAASRRICLTLPNGVVKTFGYDPDSRPTSLTFGSHGNCGFPINNPGDLGSLIYAYDPAGRVTGQTGSLASTQLPNPVSGNTFDANNTMTAFGGQPLAYDLNGNLTSDGTNAYQWDARNQLSSMSGASNASFVYDGIGRRARKTINGMTIQFLYDYQNPVQELDGSSNVTANLLAGLDTDEYFTRTDVNGQSSYLTDILGSPLALADTSGGLATQYSYDPFGGGLSSGAASANSYEYTGRENDGTGLYFYRGRYYSPKLARFLSQDPLDFGGGNSNLYAYVGGNPISNIDPFGLCDHDEKCKQLREKMDKLVNSTRGDDPSSFKGLAQRFKQALRRNSPYADSGHLEQLKNRQKELKDVIDDYIASGCGDPPAFAKEYADKPIPKFDLDPKTQQRLEQGMAQATILATILAALGYAVSFSF